VEDGYTSADSSVGAVPIADDWGITLGSVFLGGLGVARHCFNFFWLRRFGKAEERFHGGWNNSFMGRWRALRDNIVSYD